MNLSLLDTKILQLINQYSINGNLTTTTSNQDYLLRTRNLIDACQKELAVKRKIEATTNVVLTNIATNGNYTAITLPSDFKAIKNVYLQNEYYTLLSGYLIQGNSLFIDSSLEGTLVINYYKKPTTITKDTDENTELEIDEEAQELIPYYVGGWIYLEDNPTISTMLLNEYQRKLQTLKPLSPSVPIDIIDVGSDLIW